MKDELTFEEFDEIYEQLHNSPKNCKIKPTFNTKHSKIEIEGVEVLYPFEKIHQLQRDYMEKVLQALNKGQNALLESPTGTGKTLCLLSSTIAWMMKYLKEDIENKTRIYYVVRTHSQAKQVIAQIKKSCYDLHVACLGSKEQSCVKYKLGEFGNIPKSKLSAACKFARSCKKTREEDQLNENEKKDCLYYIPFKDRKNLASLDKYQVDKIRDIEEMVELGANCGFCSYYFQRYSARRANIIVMPYNYLVDMYLRKDLNLFNSVIVVDEAHNLENAMEQSSSFSISQANLQVCMINLSKLRKNFKGEAFEERFEALMKYLDNLFQRLQDFYENLTLKKLKFCEEKILDVFKIFEPLTGTGDSDDTRSLQNTLIYFSEALDRCRASDINIYSGVYELKDQINLIYKLYKNYIRRVSGEKAGEKDIDYFSFFYEKTSDDKDIMIIMRCFTPSICFRKILKRQPRSILLASGTLSPFNIIESLYKRKFPIQISNAHIIDSKKQCKTLLISRKEATDFNFSYTHRANPKLIENLGRFVLSVAESHKNGVLIVFSSYNIKQGCLEYWEKNKIDDSKTILDKIKEHKDLFDECKDSNKLKAEMNGYFNKASTERGAILTCVCRGKVSEGIDFEDEKARTVIIVGIPFPSVSDIYVIKKQSYVEKLMISRSKWIVSKAMTAANQAIGRVIRHRNDYGVVYLCDIRYHRLFNSLPAWIQQNFIADLNTDDAIIIGNKFLRDCEDRAKINNSNSNLEEEDLYEDLMNDLDYESLLDESDHFAPTILLDDLDFDDFDKNSPFKQFSISGLPTLALPSPENSDSEDVPISSSGKKSKRYDNQLFEVPEAIKRKLISPCKQNFESCQSSQSIKSENKQESDLQNLTQSEASYSEHK